MTAERWRAAWEVYEAACELPEPERRAYVGSVLSDAEAIAKVLDALEKPEDISETNEPRSSAEWSLLGKTIGRFRITGALGRGGAGEVYAAEDAELHRKVALKVLATGGIPDPACASRSLSPPSVDRFIREARAASALNHPAIITVHEVIRTEDATAIVMELVEGISLRTRCGAPQPVRLVAGWGAQIAEALAAAHARGIIHRDIKPENLMLRTDGYIKVLDFGLAHHTESGPGTAARLDGLPAGTLRYMSPEQARGEPLTGASDVFALGIVLYELAAGAHPFPAESALDTASAISAGTPLRPSEAPAAIPPEFAALAMSMLHKDPNRRPDAAAVSARLRAIAEPAQRWRPRAIAAGAIALLGILGALALWMPRSWRFAFANRPSTVLRSLPLTSLPGEETDASFSPDGEQIAYAWNGGEGNAHSIYVRRIGAGDSRRLTTARASGSSTDDFNPTWSPDGRWIAFLRQSRNTTQVLTIPAAGGAEKRIGEIRSSPMFEIHMRFLTWSLNPDELVVSDEPPGRKDNLHLYRLSLTNGSKVPMAETPEGFSDISPVFSPDARSLAFLRWGPDAAYELYVRNSDGGGERRLTASPDAIRDITWTADSRRIIYASGPSGPDRIWQVSSKGGRPEPAPFAMDGEAYQLTIAPRGHRLTYIARFLDTNIWRLDRGASGGPRLQKLIASTREDSDPRYSPDGSRIAFTSRRSGKFDIWVCNKDGSNPRQLTFRGSSTGSASWSPDGKTIAFDSESGGGSEVWLVDATGGEARPLLKPAMQAAIPNWSHDGRWIYFRSLHSGSAQIWKARPDAAGESPVQLTRNGGFEAVESADGKFLYFSKGDTHSAQPMMGIWRMPLVNGSPAGPEEPIGGTKAVGKHRCWAVSRSGIDFVDPAPKPRLRFLEFASKSISTIGGFDLPPAPFQRALSVSPDEKSFLYVQVDNNVQEIRLVENFQ